MADPADLSNSIGSPGAAPTFPLHSDWALHDALESAVAGLDTARSLIHPSMYHWAFTHSASAIHLGPIHIRVV